MPRWRAASIPFPAMRFLVLSLFGFDESRFYGRVTRELERLGHEAVHVTWSPSAARRAARARASGRSACRTSWHGRARGTRHGGRGRAASRRRTTCSRCATSTGPTGRATAQPEAVVRRAHRAPLPARSSAIFDEVRARRRRPGGRQRDDAHGRAPDRARSAASTSCSSSTRSSRARCGCTRTRCTRRSSPQDELRRAARRTSARRSRRSSPRFTAADKPIRAYRRPRVTAADAARLRPPRAVVAPPRTGDNEYLRPQRFVTNYVRERSRAARRAAAVRAARRPRAAVRLLPAARHRRLQDQARDPALRRPGVDHRAGRGVAAAGHRPRAQGAPDVDRAQPARAAAPARAASTNVRLVEPYTSSHELIRARARGRRDLLDRRAGGAALRPPGADRSGSRSTRASA